MTDPNNLTNLRLSGTAEQLDVLEQAFADQSLALTRLEGPKDHVLEVLLPRPPDMEEVNTLISRHLPDIAPQSIGFQLVPVGNLDWIKEVSATFEPLPIARWTIYGSAFKDKIPPATLGLQIDATSAFGTGEHPTTRGCLMMLDRVLRRYAWLKGGCMLDMGCGSGILAMAYIKAGGGTAWGVDLDESSVAIAQDNLNANGLAGPIKLECGCGYAPSIVDATAPYDLIMSNVFADPLCEMAGDLARHIKKGGIAILSGILNAQAAAVIRAHERHGLKLIHHMRLGAWSVLALRRPMRAS